jgi:hypothetical protein
MVKLKELRIFFPFYNDSGTVKTQIDKAYQIGKEVAENLEVIALHGGNSKDDTYQQILEAKNHYKDLKIVDKSDNQEGYAVIKEGFKTASKEWVFYTDGDAQYNLEELPKLVQKQKETGADVVNGYKINRKDNVLRIFFGEVYRLFSKILFSFPIRDVDCDFRLINNNILKKINLTSKDASILPELIVKLALQNAKFAQIPVGHNPRIYGKSNYTVFSLAKEKLVGDLKLFWKIKFKKNI